MSTACRSGKYPLRQITNFISKSTSAGATKKRAESTSMSRTDMDVVPNRLQFTSPRALRPRPLDEKPRPDDGKMYKARTAVKYIWQLHPQDPKLNLYTVADELIRDGLIPVARDNMVRRYKKFMKSIQGGHVDTALDRVRNFHDMGRDLLVDKQECAEFARSVAHHDRAISTDDVASFLTAAKKRKAREAGLDDSMCRDVSRNTLKGYLQVFEDMPRELKIHRSVQEKCERRQVAEESFMSSISFATTVAAAHFIPVPDAADADVPPADNVLARQMQQYMDKSGGGHLLVQKVLVQKGHKGACGSRQRRHSDTSSMGAAMRSARHAGPSERE